MQQSAICELINKQPDTEESTAKLLTPISVLIVEDSLSEQMRLKSIIKKNGYTVYCASNGKQALELLEKTQIHLVVSDWRMPELTGIEICHTLRNDPVYGNPYFILLTGFNSQVDLVAGMDAGADDFISKPVSNEELRVRLNAGARIIRLRDELEHQNKQLELTLSREEKIHSNIQSDLDVAARMQRELLPGNDSPFPQLSIGTLFLPAVTVAGDSFGYFKLDDEHLAFYHLDVAGHGIASAMLSFTLSRFLSPAFANELLCEVNEVASENNANKNTTDHIVPPHEVVTMLNQRFQENQECSHYFTMIYGVLNVNSGLGSFCQAGHPHPLHVKRDGSINKLGDGGYPVGIFDNAVYESVSFQLKQGERLYLYSDGITDVTNPQGNTVGFNRYEHMLKTGSQLPVKNVITRIDSFLHKWNGNKNFDDDISLLVLDYQGIN